VLDSVHSVVHLAEEGGNSSCVQRLVQAMEQRMVVAIGNREIHRWGVVDLLSDDS
jgi:hypothetical protein